MTDTELNAIEVRYKDICYRHEDIPLLVAEVRQLRKAIRKHRDQRGDDRCWLDDEELYRALPEGYTPPAREIAVELAHCERFLTCRRNPATEYVSPQREIERLEKLVKELQSRGRDQ